MAQADWKEFRNGFTSNYQLFTDNSPVFGFPTGGSGAPVLTTKLESGGAIPKIWGQIYNGPGAGVFPTKFCSVAMTYIGVPGGSVGAATFRCGPLIAMTSIGDDQFYKGTPTIDADLDIVMVGFTNKTDNGGVLNSLRIADAVNVVGGEAGSDFIDTVSATRVQFEVGFLLDDIVPTEEQFRIFYRHNQGTAIEDPGGPNWTDWLHLTDYDFATELVGAGIDVSNGFFPGFGWWVDDASIDWDNPSIATFNMNFDDIRVTNYTEIPP